MNLKQIYQPISKDLSRVEIELKNVVAGFIPASVNEIINHFFNIPGKRLRPALVLLSAKAVDSQLSSPTINGGGSTLNSQLIFLATAVELIHSASLIHDDIVDNAVQRREQPSLNKQFGNRIAVLAGDMLHARAFSLLVDKFDKEILRVLSQCIEKMCRGEINELSRGGLARPIFSYEEYLKIIEDKTAAFMSVCCQTGAMLTGKNKKAISALKEYGFNFGISYQLMDDFLDGDSGVEPLGSSTGLKPLLQKAKEFTTRAKENITFFNNSKYKKGLQNLADYVVSQKIMSKDL